VETPALDALRENGTWATSAVAPSNQTVPSHLSLLGAIHIEKHGCRANGSPWPSSEQLRERWDYVPLAERFRRAGYRTAGIVTNRLLRTRPESPEYQTFEEGFETWAELYVGILDPGQPALGRSVSTSCSGA
jgi:arylsulfatase A-like enzyme